MIKASDLKEGDKIFSTTGIEYKVISNHVGDVIELETEIHHKVRAFRYTPKIKFCGSVKECFTKDGLESTISMFKEFKEFNNGTS